MGGKFLSPRPGAPARRGALLLTILALAVGPMVVTDPAGAVEIRLTPDADARVEAEDPDDNFGSSSRLVADSDPATESYLRFSVPALGGVVTRATLRLRTEDSTSNGPEVRRTADDWAEADITWANRPAPVGDLLDDAGKLKSKTWVSYDVTAAVTGTGPVSFHLGADSSDGVTFTSRQSRKNRPELVVETQPAPTATTTTTTTTAATTTTSTTTTTTTLPPTTTTTLAPTTTTTVPPTTTTTTTAPPPADTVPEPGEPWLGLARLVTITCEPACVGSTYSLSVEDVTAGDAGDRRSAYRYPPGESRVLRLEWARAATGGSGGCGSPAPVTMDVSLRRPGGARIGAAVWTAGIPATCNGALQREFTFDADPLDGDADAPYHGVMEVYGRLSDAGPATGADTRGAVPVDPADQPGRYARGHLVSGGVMVGWHEDGDDAGALAANEAAVGEPFGLVRSYSSAWREPSLRVPDWLAAGKFVLWSVKPPDDPAGNNDWTPVADGSQDAVIRQQVARLQTWAEAGGTQAGYIFNHEPHDDADLLGVVDDCELLGDSDHPCAGTAAEFIDSYQRIRAVIDELGADRVKLVYTATLSRAAETAPGSTVLGSGDAMTQGEGGESVVGYADLIAHDSYNWYCFRSACEWDFPDASGGWERGVRLAETQGKQLIIAETASHPGCGATGQPPGFGCEDEDPGDLPSPTRDDWLARIGTWLESDARARRWIVGFAYFHTVHSHDWRFVGQTGPAASGLEGWRNVFVVDSPLNDGLGGHDYFAQYGFNNL